MNEHELTLWREFRECKEQIAYWEVKLFDLRAEINQLYPLDSEWKAN